MLHRPITLERGILSILTHLNIHSNNIILPLKENMKAVIISILLLISLNTFSQVTVLTPTGDTTISFPQTVVTLIAPLRNPNPSNRLDSTTQELLFNTVHFRVNASGALELVNPPVKVPIPRADIRQPKTATSNQKVLPFRNLPTSYDDYILTKGRLILIPIRDYTMSGDTITLTLPSQSGTMFELIMLVRER